MSLWKAEAVDRRLLWLLVDGSDEVGQHLGHARDLDLDYGLSAVAGLAEKPD